MNVLVDGGKKYLYVLLSTDIGKDIPGGLIHALEKYNTDYSPREWKMERAWLGFRLAYNFDDVDYVIKALNHHGISAGPLLKLWNDLKEDK
ncbi:hypothetical protein V6C27_03085 [Peptococcaceae bacterium 1198_IL3148]